MRTNLSLSDSAAIERVHRGRGGRPDPAERPRRLAPDRDVGRPSPCASGATAAARRRAEQPQRLRRLGAHQRVGVGQRPRQRRDGRCCGPADQAQRLGRTPAHLGAAVARARWTSAPTAGAASPRYEPSACAARQRDAGSPSPRAAASCAICGSTVGAGTGVGGAAAVVVDGVVAVSRARGSVGGGAVGRDDREGVQRRLARSHGGGRRRGGLPAARRCARGLAAGS